MEDFPRRRTRATGFSPGGPRELTDAPRRPTRGGRRSHAVDTVTAPNDTRTAPAVKRATRRAKALSSESVDNTGVNDADVAILGRRGRGQTRSARPRTRSSSPSESIETANRRSRSPQYAAARAPRPALAGRAKGRGKRAREEEIAEVSGSAENVGEDDLGERDASPPRPAKRVRAGVRGGEELRKQLEQEKVSIPAAQAVSASSPVGEEASVSSAEVETPMNLGMFADTAASLARGSGGEIPCTTTPLEVASPEAPLVIESIETPLARIDGPATLDDGAVSPVILHERTGEELIAEQRAAADLRKWVRLGRRHATVMKAPSECGSDEEEAGRAAAAFRNELRPPPLPTYQASKRYVEWSEGKHGMLVVEAAEGPDVDADAAKTRMIRRRFLKPSSLVQGDRSSKTVLVPTLIGDANILTALTTTLDWLHKNLDTVPTASEVVQVLDKFKMGKRKADTKVFRAPSPSDPLSSDDFDSDGEPIPRYRPRRAKKSSPVPPPSPAPAPALLKPSFTGKADSHLPMIYRGVQFKLLPKELQGHPLSWRIKERDAIFAANSPPDAAEAAFNAKKARRVADAARKAAAKEKAEAARKPAQASAKISPIAVPSTPTTPSQMSVSTSESNEINKLIKTGPTPTVSSGSFGLFYGKNYIDDSDSDISDGEADKTPAVDAAGKIRDAIPVPEISPQIETIPRKPRVVRETFYRSHRKPKSEIKKLFMHKYRLASQEAHAPPPTPTPAARTRPAEPVTPFKDLYTPPAPLIDISHETHVIVNTVEFAYALQTELDTFDNSDLMRVFHRRFNAAKFGIDRSIAATVEEIPDEEFEPMMMDLTYLTPGDSPSRADPKFGIDPDISAIVEDIPGDEFEPMELTFDSGLTFGTPSPRSDAEFIIDPSVWEAVNSIPDNEFDGLRAELNLGNLLQSRPEFSIDPSILGMVNTIPQGEFDSMMMDIPLAS